MPNQVDGALLRAPCPVPSCPACEPNSGSVPRAYQRKRLESSGADILMQSSSKKPAPKFSGWQSRFDSEQW